MANPREARGWFVYALGVVVAIFMLAFRLHYGGSSPSPSLLVPWIDIPFVLAVLAGVIAAFGLSQALWAALVKPGGFVVFAASLLMFAVGTFFLYALPAHLATRTFFLLMFTAAIVLYLYVPALSWDSKTFRGIGVAGAAVVLAASVYGPYTGSTSFTEPLVALTLGAEAALVALLLWLLQLSLRRAPAVAAA